MKKYCCEISVSQFQVKVVDREGNIVPLGEPGEVWFRSYSTMVCYWEDEEMTKEIITEGRWLKSG